MQYNNIELAVKVRGSEIVQYLHEGKTFIEGREGTQYSLQIKNHHYYRTKVVISVDGVNVINGKPAGSSSSEIGYILDPYSGINVAGYRLDNNSVAAFKFTNSSKGYAQKEKEMVGTTGVIGVRAYREYRTPVNMLGFVPFSSYSYFNSSTSTSDGPIYGSTCADSTFYESAPRGGSASNNLSFSQSSIKSDSLNRSTKCSAQAAATPEKNPFNLGSTFGNKMKSEAINVDFITGEFIAQLDLFYANKEGLKALGVEVIKKDKLSFPTAFDAKYCAPPAGWNG